MHYFNTDGHHSEIKVKIKSRKIMYVLLLLYYIGAELCVGSGVDRCSVASHPTTLPTLQLAEDFVQHLVAQRCIRVHLDQLCLSKL